MENVWKFPPCFKTRADYELWLDSPNTSTDLTSKHCTDCLPSFKMRRMAARGLCFHAETVFSFTPSEFDGEVGVEIQGHWNRHEQPKPQIVRFVKPKPRREVPAPKRQEREQDVHDWWASRHQALMEKLNR